MTGTILTRLFGRYFKPAPVPEPAIVVDDTQIADTARNHVAAGFLSRDEIVDVVRSYFADEVDEQRLRDVVPAMVDDALRAHDRIQLSWPAITDCDRLDAAFEALEAEGIVARQDFSCCGTCGDGDIFDEIAAAAASPGATPRGYVYYHQQTTESVVEYGDMYLRFGSTEEGEDSALAIGWRIVAVLKASGLAVDWNGSWDRCIGVTLDWKRRRTC